jgi:hypothetical protein
MCVFVNGKGERFIKDANALQNEKNDVSQLRKSVFG